jgi:hypothetical protein
VGSLSAGGAHFVVPDQKSSAHHSAFLVNYEFLRICFSPMPVMRFHYLLILVFATVFTFVSTGCNKEDVVVKKKPKPFRSKIARPNPRMNPMQARIFNTNFSEELTLAMTPGLQQVAKKLQGAPADLKAFFNDSVAYRGPADFDLAAAVASHTSSETTNQNHLVGHIAWPLSDTTVQASPDKIWDTVLKDFKFEDAQFGVMSSEVLKDADVFVMATTFEGRLLDDQQRAIGVKAKQTLEWAPTSSGQWKIKKWDQKKLEIVCSPKSLFKNVTATAIPDAVLGETLARSLHEELTVARTEKQAVLKRANMKYPHFSDWQNSYQYPSVSVVDIDQDQWDDLFVMDRWGKSVLLRNKGDQTFEDVSESSGLKLNEAFANCAMFVDFDNDGDSDVLIGRTVESSLYFRNDGGKFVPDTANNQVLKEIKFVSSGSVVDVNRDGLLDVYLSTYCYTRDAPTPEWTKDAVRKSDRLMMQQYVDGGQAFLNRGGPPNVLLMNRGGKFERVKINNQLKQWKNSFQSVWSDIDLDGDADLYICNDFAPDVFLRNDTEQGSFTPEFSEFDNKIFPTDAMGFGMGASFGDFNSDGALDLYVSNMYSKAGHRVFKQIGGDIDPRILVSAKGNYLYENTGGKFKQVAGLKDGQQHVSKVGWSFGSQFADFNNDGQLDIYAPSGFYTAPQPIDAQVDL